MQSGTAGVETGGGSAEEVVAEVPARGSRAGCGDLMSAVALAEALTAAAAGAGGAPVAVGTLEPAAPSGARCIPALATRAHAGAATQLCLHQVFKGTRAPAF